MNRQQHKARTLSPASVQKRPPRKRAFAGLVGREVTEEVRPELSQQVVAQIEENKRRQQAQVSLEKDYSEAMSRFQEYAFDPKLRGARSEFDSASGKVRFSRGTSSRGWSADGPAHLAFAQLFTGNSKNQGLTIIAPKAEQCSFRARTPWWIANGLVYEDFLRRIVDESSDAEVPFLKGAELREAAGLDHTILYEFYFIRKEDDEIFERYVEKFRREPGKQRPTSSASAVKMRRTRLVKEGDALYGKGVRPVEGPEHQEHLAFWTDIRLRPSPNVKRTEK